MKLKVGMGIAFYTGVLLLGYSGLAQAILVDRGGGLIYDDVLDITWLQDANYSRTSGYDENGRMNWSLATEWAGSLSYYDSVRSITWSDWRLPRVTDMGNDGCDFSNLSYDGGDCGWNVDTSTGELASLWYDTLGNLAYCDTLGNCPQTDWGLNSSGPFLNLQPYYWTNTVNAAGFGAWDFDVDSGFQSIGYQRTEYVWAVRSGDVIRAIPEPGSILLFGLGLMGLVGVMRSNLFRAHS